MAFPIGLIILVLLAVVVLGGNLAYTPEVLQVSGGMGPFAHVSQSIVVGKLEGFGLAWLWLLIWLVVPSLMVFQSVINTRTVSYKTVPRLTHLPKRRFYTRRELVAMDSETDVLVLDPWHLGGLGIRAETGQLTPKPMMSPKSMLDLFNQGVYYHADDKSGKWRKWRLKYVRPKFNKIREEHRRKETARINAQSTRLRRHAERHSRSSRRPKREWVDLATLAPKEVPEVPRPRKRRVVEESDDLDLDWSAPITIAPVSPVVQETSSLSREEPVHVQMEFQLHPLPSVAPAGSKTKGLVKRQPDPSHMKDMQEFRARGVFVPWLNSFMKFASFVGPHCLLDMEFQEKIKKDIAETVERQRQKNEARRSCIQGSICIGNLQLMSMKSRGSCRWVSTVAVETTSHDQPSETKSLQVKSRCSHNTVRDKLASKFVSEDGMRITRSKTRAMESLDAKAPALPAIVPSRIQPSRRCKASRHC